MYTVCPMHSGPMPHISKAWILRKGPVELDEVVRCDL